MQGGNASSGVSRIQARTWKASQESIAWTQSGTQCFITDHAGQRKALKSLKALATLHTENKPTVVIIRVGEGVDKINLENVDVARKRKEKSIVMEPNSPRC
ncbi:unnamed protein product [Calypogeia fissa]